LNPRAVHNEIHTVPFYKPRGGGVFPVYKKRSGR
jgi:hypothetical protein